MLYRCAPLFLALAVASGCGSPSSEGAATKPPDGIPVTVATANVRDVPIDVRAVGTVSPYSTVAVKSQVDGQLAEAHFREGDEVHRGDLLFVIDARPFEAAPREAEAKLAEDRATAVRPAGQATGLDRPRKEGLGAP